MTTDTSTSPFSRFIALEDYVAKRPEIFQTRSAPKHLLRYRGLELQQAGALLNAGRQMMIDPGLADELVLGFFRRDGAIKPPGPISAVERGKPECR